VTELPNVLASLTIAAGVAAVFDVPALRTGLNVADEGYLWHGTLQVLNRAVPIRDFRAYDPGRYYWCALFCLIFGRRNLSLRLAMLTLKVVTLALLAGLIHHATGDWLATALWTVAAGACSPRWYKSAEGLSAIMAVTVATALLNGLQPTMQAVAAAFTGLSLLFGLNLALYNATALAAACLFALTRIGPEPISPAWIAAGLLAGLAPVVFLFATVPGLWTAYVRHKILPVLRRRTTNLPLPIPWLWKPTPPQVCGPPAYVLAIKAGFTALPLFHAGVLAWRLVAAPSDEAWVRVATATACVGVCYMHYSMSRADPEHLSPAWPLLATGIASLAPGGGVGVVVAFCGAVAMITCLYRSVDECALRRRHPETFVRYHAGADHFWLPTSLASWLESIREVVETRSRDGDPVLFVPLLVTLYPLWSRRVPVYDMFCVHRPAAGAEDAMIASIEGERVRLAVVWNVALDGLEERRFSRTHPLVWEYLETRFEPCALSRPLEDLHCFVRTD
jgi:hypothetical protein